MQEILKDLQVLTGMSEQDYAVLRQHSTLMQNWTDEFVNAFYDILFSYDRTLTVFPRGMDERPDREKTLRMWYESVTNG